MKIFKLVILLFVVTNVISHEVKTKQFYTQIKQFYLTHLWKNDSINTPQNTDEEKTIFPESIGFIGDSFKDFL